MKKNAIKVMCPELAVTAAAFYLLPLLMQNTGAAILVILAVLPFVCVVTAAVLGYKKGFMWLYALLTGLLFVPSIFLFYNSSAWVYAPAYGLLALAGNFAGSRMRRKDTEKR